jgi:hypothetical protein
MMNAESSEATASGQRLKNPGFTGFGSVFPPSNMSGPKFIHLVFYDNPSDTTIKSVKDDQVLYQIKTVDDPEAVLTLCDAQGEIIGSLHLKKRHSDLLTLGSQGPQMASNDWLKKAKWSR